MANLVITIIGIALIALAALAGAFYGGQAFLGNTPQVRANTLLSQSRQLLAVDTQYMLDNNFSTFSSFAPDSPIINNYMPGRVTLLDFDAYGGSTSGQSISALSTSYPQHINCIPSWTPAVLDSSNVIIIRSNTTIFNTNVILYNFITVTSGDCHGSGNPGLNYYLASSATDPVVQMCLKINGQLGVPAGLTYAPSGLPYTTNAEALAPQTSATSNLRYDSVNSSAFNYCYIIQDSYWGGGTKYAIAILAIAN